MFPAGISFLDGALHCSLCFCLAIHLNCDSMLPVVMYGYGAVSDHLDIQFSLPVSGWLSGIFLGQVVCAARVNIVFLCLHEFNWLVDSVDSLLAVSTTALSES